MRARARTMYVPDDIRSFLYATRRVRRMRVYRGYIRASRCTFVPFVFSRKAIDARCDGRDSRESRRNRDCKSSRGLSLRAAARLRPSAARFRRGWNFSDRTCDELSPRVSVPLARRGCIPRGAAVSRAIKG